MLWHNRDPTASPRQYEQLHQHANTAARGCRDRRAGDAKLRKRAEAEDEAGIENDVDAACNPQDAHRDSGIASAAEDRIDQKQQHDDDVAAQHDLRERGMLQDVA